PAAIIARRKVRRQSRLRIRTHSFKTRKQASLNKHLKTVAYPQNWATVIRKCLQLPTQFRQNPLRPDHPSPNVISISKPSWKNQSTIIQQVPFLHNVVHMHDISTHTQSLKRSPRLRIAISPSRAQNTNPDLFMLHKSNPTTQRPLPTPQQITQRSVHNH